MKINQKQVFLTFFFLFSQALIFGGDPNNSSKLKDALQLFRKTIRTPHHETAKTLLNCYQKIEEIDSEIAKELILQHKFKKYVGTLIKNERFDALNTISALFLQNENLKKQYKTALERYSKQASKHIKKQHNSTIISTHLEDKAQYKRGNYTSEPFNVAIFKPSITCKNFTYNFSTHKNVLNEFIQLYLDRLNNKQIPIIIENLTRLNQQDWTYFLNQATEKIVFCLREANYLETPDLMEICIDTLRAKATYNDIRNLPSELYTKIDPQNLFLTNLINNAIKNRLPNGVETTVKNPIYPSVNLNKTDNSNRSQIYVNPKDTMLKTFTTYALSPKGKVFIFLPFNICFLWDPYNPDHIKATGEFDWSATTFPSSIESITESKATIGLESFSTLTYDFSQDRCYQGPLRNADIKRSETYFYDNKKMIEDAGLSITCSGTNTTFKRFDFKHLYRSLNEEQKAFLLSCSTNWIKSQPYKLPLNEHALFESLPIELKQPELFETSSIERFVAKHKDAITACSLIFMVNATTYAFHKLGHK